MRILKLYFTILSLVVSTSYADITPKQVTTYLEVSGAQAIFESLQTQLGDAIDAQLRTTGKVIDPIALTTIKEIMTSDKNINLFTGDIKKLDLKLYQKILDFYATDLGKKGAQLAKKLDMMTMQEEIITFLKVQKENPFSVKKIALIQDITSASKAIELETDIAKAMFQAMNKHLPKENKMPKEQMEMMLTQLAPALEEQANISMNYSLKDYNEKELQEILVFTQSEEGVAEIQMISKGTLTYIEVTMSEMMNRLIKTHK